MQFLLSKCQVGSIAKVNAVMSHEIDAKAVVWGSSTALVHFNPEIIERQSNLSCINLGMDGVPFQQYSGLLQEFIEHARSTEVIILSIDITGFKRRPSLYLGYNWLHHINNGYLYESLKSIDPDLVFKSRYIPMYYITTYDRRFLIRCLTWVNSSSKYEHELDFKGFHPKDLVWEAPGNEVAKIDVDDEIFKIRIDSEIFSKFQEVISMATKRNIKVAIVVPPCYQQFQERLIGVSQFQDSLKSLESSSVKVFDYLSNAICSNQTYFYNNLHLNALGADNFTSSFSMDLKMWMDGTLQEIN